jgi:hypothetical protein
MGRTKKPKAVTLQEENPTKAAETQPKEFSEVPAEDSPEYVEYIKSIRVSNEKSNDKKGFGEILKEANEARKNKARKLKEAAELRAKEIADGKTVKK